jgi:hypothetical protein
MYPHQFLNVCTNLYETLYVYRVPWAHLNDVLHKSLALVCVCLCVSPSIVPRHGSVNTFPRLRVLLEAAFLCDPCIKGESMGVSVYPPIVATEGSVNTFPLQRRIVRGVVLYVVIKGKQVIVLPRTSWLHLYYPLFETVG